MTATTPWMSVITSLSPDAQNVQCANVCTSTFGFSIIVALNMVALDMEMEMMQASKKQEPKDLRCVFLELGNNAIVREVFKVFSLRRRKRGNMIVTSLKSETFHCRASAEVIAIVVFRLDMISLLLTSRNSSMVPVIGNSVEVKVIIAQCANLI